jgi:hypothetical protein
MVFQGGLLRLMARDRTLILREDLDAGRVTWGDMDSGERLPAVHPGDFSRASVG